MCLIPRHFIQRMERRCCAVPPEWNRLWSSRGRETIADGAFAGSAARCIILPEGLKRVSAGAFANMAANGAVAVVVPESAVVEQPAFSPSDGTCLCLFSTENGMPACTFIGGGSFAAVEVPEVWAFLDYLTPEEIYSGVAEPTYGFKQVLTRDGLFQ